MEIGYIGLGKMGLNMVERLRERGHRVIAFNRGEEGRQRARQEGIDVVNSFAELVGKLGRPRNVWLMIPYNVVDAVLRELASMLEAGDRIIDGGNSFYKDSIRRGRELLNRGIKFLDVGVSGGPSGARNGACLMVGGEESVMRELRPLFDDLAVAGGFAHVGAVGAGHFVKMVHNGIEYGMMQAIAEGFSLLKSAPFGFNLTGIAEVYNHGSVIESRLIGWLSDGFRSLGDGLEKVSSAVPHTGEGQWTIESSNELGVYLPVIERAFLFRLQSNERPSYTGKILTLLRHQFGGHELNQST